MAGGGRTLVCEYAPRINMYGGLSRSFDQAALAAQLSSPVEACTDIAFTLL